MSYPARSNFQSGEPGAAWAILGLPSSALGGEVPDEGGFFGWKAAGADPDVAHPGEKVVESQWDAILRAFQSRARALLVGQWRFNTDLGRCDMGPMRTAEDIPVNGAWGQETAEAFGALLCASGVTAVSPGALLPTQARPAFTAEAVRAILAFAFVITKVGTPDAPYVPVYDKIKADNIRVPTNAVLPSTAVLVHSPALDERWYATFDPQTDAAPVPPSRSPGATQPPAPAPWPPTRSEQLAGGATLSAGTKTLLILTAIVAGGYAARAAYNYAQER
jgi:hypothetical protein